MKDTTLAGLATGTFDCQATKLRTVSLPDLNCTSSLSPVKTSLSDTDDVVDSDGYIKQEDDKSIKTSPDANRFVSVIEGPYSKLTYLIYIRITDIPN